MKGYGVSPSFFPLKIIKDFSDLLSGDIICEQSESSL
jgi:hypothetical protein